MMLCINILRSRSCPLGMHPPPPLLRAKLSPRLGIRLTLSVDIYAGVRQLYVGKQGCKLWICFLLGRKGLRTTEKLYPQVSFGSKWDDWLRRLWKNSEHTEHSGCRENQLDEFVGQEMFIVDVIQYINQDKYILTDWLLTNTLVMTLILPVERDWIKNRLSCMLVPPYVAITYKSRYISRPWDMYI